MSTKCVIYLEGVNRGIVLTDNDKSVSAEKLIENLTDAMTGSKLVEIKTGTDNLIVRPNQINAVHIQGGPYVGSARKKSPQTKPVKAPELHEIIPELDLGDDLEDNISDDELEVSDIKLPGEELSEKIDKTENIKTEKEKVEEVLEKVDEKVKELSAEDSVVKEVEAWHSKADAVKEEASKND